MQLVCVQQDFRRSLEPLIKERSLTPYPSRTVLPISSEELVIALQGIVLLATSHPDGEEKLLGVVGPMVPIGRPLTLLDPYQVITLTAVEILRIPFAEVQASAAFSAGLYQQLIWRLRQTEAWLALAHIRLKSERLRHLLHLLAQEFGQPVPQGVKISIRLTHEQLASAIGVTRVTVTRLLKQLRTEKIVQIENRHIILPEVEFTKREFLDYRAA